MRTQVLVLCLLCLTTWSQAQQPPKPAPSAKADSAKAAGGKERSDRDQYPAEGTVVIINNQAEPVPRESAAKAETDENLKINRRLALFTGLLVAVGVIQFIALVCQARALIHHSKLIKRSSQHTARVAAAARRTAEALMNGDKAWVLVEDIEPPQLFAMMVATVKFNEFVFDLVNRGRTIARLTGPYRYRFHSLQRRDELPDIPDYAGRPASGPTYGNPPEPKPDYGRVLAPGQHNGKMYLQLGEWVDEQKLQAIEKGDVVLYVYASLIYFDTFDRQRELRFGYEYWPKAFTGSARWVTIRKEEYNKHT